MMWRGASRQPTGPNVRFPPIPAASGLMSAFDPKQTLACEQEERPLARQARLGDRGDVAQIGATAAAQHVDLWEALSKVTI